MPKHYRQCGMCTNNSTNAPDVVIFRANAHIVSALNLQAGVELLICEKHFNDEDVKIHGKSKRLGENCLPVNFPMKESVMLDHCYVTTSPLVFVSKVYDPFFDVCIFKPLSVFSP